MSRNSKKIVAGTLAAAMMTCSVAQTWEQADAFFGSSAVVVKAAADKGPTVAINEDVESMQLKAGDEFTVKINATDNEKGYSSLITWLDIDLNVFEVVETFGGDPDVKGWKKSTQNSDTSFTEYFKDPSDTNALTLVILYMSADNVNIEGDSPVATIKLKVKDDAKDGKYQLFLDEKTDGTAKCNVLDEKLEPSVLEPTYISRTVTIGDPVAEETTAAETTTVEETTAAAETTTVEETTAAAETTTVKDTTAAVETTTVEETTAAVAVEENVPAIFEIGEYNEEEEGLELLIKNNKGISCMQAEYKLTGKTDASIKKLYVSDFKGSWASQGSAIQFLSSNGRNIDAEDGILGIFEFKDLEDGEYELTLSNFEATSYNLDTDKQDKFVYKNAVSCKITVKDDEIVSVEKSETSDVSETTAADETTTVEETTTAAETTTVEETTAAAETTTAEETTTAKVEETTTAEETTKATEATTTEAVEETTKATETTKEAEKAAPVEFAFAAVDTVEDASKNVAVALKANNNTGFSGIQANVSIEGGITIADKLASDFDGEWSVSKKKDRIQFISSNGRNIEAKDANAATFELKLPEGIKDGTYKLTVSDISVAKLENKKQVVTNYADPVTVDIVVKNAAVVEVTTAEETTAAVEETTTAKVEETTAAVEETTAKVEETTTSTTEKTDGPVVSIDKNLSVMAGEEVTFAIKVSGNDNGYSSLISWLDIDTDVFELVDIKAGDPNEKNYSKTPQAANTNITTGYHKDGAAANIETAVILYFDNSNENFKGDNVLATVTLKAKADAKKGSYAIAFDAQGDGTAMCNRVIDKKAVVVVPSYVNGSIEVKEADETTAEVTTPASETTTVSETTSEVAADKPIFTFEEVDTTFKADKDNVATLYFDIKNNTGINAAEASISVSDGISIDSVDVADFEDGKWTTSSKKDEMQFVSNNGKNIDTKEGRFAKINVVLPKGIKDGEYKVTISNLSISKQVDNKEVVTKYADPITATIVVDSAKADTIKGDVDNNGVVNAEDMVKLKKFILLAADKSTVPNGDVDGNGTINVVDLVNLVKILLNAADKQETVTTTATEATTTAKVTEATTTAKVTEATTTAKVTEATTTAKVTEATTTAKVTEATTTAKETEATTTAKVTEATTTAKVTEATTTAKVTEATTTAKETEATTTAKETDATTPAEQKYPAMFAIGNYDAEEEGVELLVTNNKGISCMQASYEIKGPGVVNISKVYQADFKGTWASKEGVIQFLSANGRNIDAEDGVIGYFDFTELKDGDYEITFKDIEATSYDVDANKQVKYVYEGTFAGKFTVKDGAVVSAGANNKESADADVTEKVTEATTKATEAETTKATEATTTAKVIEATTTEKVTDATTKADQSEEQNVPAVFAIGKYDEDEEGVELLATSNNGISCMQASYEIKGAGNVSLFKVYVGDFKGSWASKEGVIQYLSSNGRNIDAEDGVLGYLEFDNLEDGEYEITFTDIQATAYDSESDKQIKYNYEKPFTGKFTVKDGAVVSACAVETSGETSETTKATEATTTKATEATTTKATEATTTKATEATTTAKVTEATTTSEETKAAEEGLATSKRSSVGTADGPTVKVNTEGADSLKPGDEFQIKLDLTDNTAGYSSLITWLDYDKNVFEVVEANGGDPSVKGWKKSSQCSDTSFTEYAKEGSEDINTLVMLYMNADNENVEGDLTYATITLKVKDDAKAGTYALNLDADTDGKAVCNVLDEEKEPSVLRPLYIGGTVTVK